MFIPTSTDGLVESYIFKKKFMEDVGFESVVHLWSRKDTV